MIEVAYYGGGPAHELIIKGHAGYSDHGNDIVCAGVSAITFTLLGFLDNHKDDIESISAQTKSGHAHITCKGGKTTELAFDMALIGLQQIAMKYPKHVTIHIHPVIDG